MPDTITEIPLHELKNKWHRFWKKRSQNQYLDSTDPDYITVVEREEIIEMLFKYIEENYES